MKTEGTEYNEHKHAWNCCKFIHFKLRKMVFERCNGGSEMTTARFGFSRRSPSRITNQSTCFTLFWFLEVMNMPSVTTNPVLLGNQLGYYRHKQFELRIIMAGIMTQNFPGSVCTAGPSSTPERSCVLLSSHTIFPVWRTFSLCI